MQKIFTNLVTASLMLGTIGATAQTQIWPTTDSATIKASQFAGDTTVFTLNRANPTLPANFKGWYTKGLTSSSYNPIKVDSSVWTWTSTGISRGAYGRTSGSAVAIASPTQANGSVIFDSNYLDNRGVSGGDTTGQSASPHSGEIVSPIMNIVGFNNVSVVLNQYFKNFDAETYVTWSEDGGATWKTPIQFNTEIATSSGKTATNDVATIKLKGSVGTANFRIKFIFDGDYYFWTIDDVKIVKVTNDLKVNPFIAIAPSYVIQKNQTEDMRFLLDIANNGALPAHNVKVRFLMARIAGGVPTIIYRDSLTYGTVQPDTTIENRILPGTLPASALTLGSYQGVYQVVSDSIDQVPVDNTLSFNFVVNDSIYSKEGGGTLSFVQPAGSNWATAAEPRTWRTGCYYYVKTGVGHTITSGSASIANLDMVKGQRLSFGLYEWNDANNNNTIEPAERVLVAYGDTLIPQSQTATQALLTFQLKDINTQKWFFPSNNKHYLAMVEFDPTGSGLNVYAGYIKSLDYGAFIYLQDSLYRTGLGARRFGPILGIKPDANWSTVGFGRDYVPVARLNMVPYRVKDETLTAAHKMEVFPNPASETVTLSVDLPHAVNAILVQTLDNNGHLLQEQQFKNVQKDNLLLNIADLPSGTYMLRILTPDGTRMKKLIVLK